MRIVYLANARLPGEKAHAIQILKTCAALAASADVCLVHARRSNRPWLKQIDDLQSYYGLPRDVPRRAIPSLDLFWLAARLPFGRGWGFRFVFAVQQLSYHLALVPYLVTAQADVFYTRDSLTAALLILLRRGKGAGVFFEAHSFPQSRAGLLLQGWLAHRLTGLVVLTRPAAERYVGLGCPAGRVAVVPDAADVDAFGRCTRAEARRRVGAPLEAGIVMYVGQMYPWKGAHVLVDAASDLPAGCQVWLVGGTPEDLPRIEKMVQEKGARNVKLIGYVSPTEVPCYLAAADVLVLPNSGRADISRHYTSPLKLFEYLAAERPVVASDLPSLREVLRDGENAILVPPDDPQALAGGIRRALADRPLAERLARQGRQDVQAHTWPARAQAILDFIGQ